MRRVARHGPVTNTQQTYRPLKNTSQPASRDRAERLAAVSNGPFVPLAAYKNSPPEKSLSVSRPSRNTGTLHRACLSKRIILAC